MTLCPWARHFTLLASVLACTYCKLLWMTKCKCLSVAQSALKSHQVCVIPLFVHPSVCVSVSIAHKEVDGACCPQTSPKPWFMFLNSSDHTAPSSRGTCGKHMFLRHDVSCRLVLLALKMTPLMTQRVVKENVKKKIYIYTHIY